jgi:hypothetical protein
VFFELALRGLKATIIFVEQNENVGKKRAAKMPHPNEIFGISISLLPEGDNYPETGLVKTPSYDTRPLNPSGMFGGKAPHR